MVQVNYGWCPKVFVTPQHFISLICACCTIYLYKKSPVILKFLVFLPVPQLFY